jgi:hypothetical protein
MDPGLFDASEQITKLREVFSSIIVGYETPTQGPQSFSPVLA